MIVFNETKCRTKIVITKRGKETFEEYVMSLVTNVEFHLPAKPNCAYILNEIN